MKYQLNKKIHFILLVILVMPVMAYAQTIPDSLFLDNIIQIMEENNPALKQMDEKTNSAELKEQLVRTAYLPYIYASANAVRLFPIPSFDIVLPDPEGGDPMSRQMQMYPDISQDYGLKMNQMIYDFGKTKNTEGLQKTLTELTRLSNAQLKQKLILAAAGYYYSLLYLQNAVKIRAAEIETLKQHLDVILKKQETGSATQYEILTTKVRISATETQLTDLQSNLTIISSHLCNIMGIPETEYAVKDLPETTFNEYTTTDSLFSFALDHRYEMLMAGRNEEAATWNYKIAQSRSNPSLSLMGGAGYKNGYISDINALKFNYSVGLSLNVPIFENNRKKIGKEIAHSAVIESQLETENVGNKISDEVRESFENITLSEKKMDQFKVQLNLAKEAYSHAETNYYAGAITNLDLLDSSNALAESKLMLLRAQMEYKYNLVKLKSAMGIVL